MDYIKLKRTLVAAFDHFLSCHDMAELEEMMQALEAGKQLVIGFPEPIHREDYKDDVLAREDQKDDVLAREDQKDDVLAREGLMAAPVKKTMSRMRRKTPKVKKAPIQAQKYLCDIPVFMDMSVLSNEKQKQLCKALETEQHHITLKDVMIKGRHILAMAKVSVPAQPRKISGTLDAKPLWAGISQEPVISERTDGTKEKIMMLFHEKKQFDPP